MELLMTKHYNNFDDLMETINQMLTIIKQLIGRHMTEDEAINRFSLTLLSCKAELQRLRNASFRNNTNWVFIGKVSSGKTSLINNILKTPILPTGCGTTTANIIEIRGTNKQNGFLYLISEDNLVNKDLSEVKNILSTPQINHCVKLFLPVEQCEKLGNFITLYDTPGLGKNKNTSDLEELCRDADFLVLVVSCLTGLLEEDIDMLNKLNLDNSSIKIILIFTFWDFPSSEEEKQELKSKLEKEVSDRLCQNNFNTALKLYYICTLPDVAQSAKSQSTTCWDDFTTIIEETSRDLPYFRKIGCLKRSEDLVETCLMRLKNLVESVKCQLKENYKVKITQISESSETTALIDDCKMIIIKTLDIICNSLLKLANECKEFTSLLDNKDVIEKELYELQIKIEDRVEQTSFSEIVKVFFKDFFIALPVQLLGFSKSDETSINEALKNLAGAVSLMKASTEIATKITGRDISVGHLLRVIKRPFGFSLETGIKNHFKEIKILTKTKCENFKQLTEEELQNIVEEMDNSLETIRFHLEKAKKEAHEFNMLSTKFL